MPRAKVEKVRKPSHINGEEVEITHTIFYYSNRGRISSESWKCKDISAHCNTFPRDKRGNFFYNPHGPNHITYYRSGGVRSVSYGVESIDYQKKSKGFALKAESFTYHGRKDAEAYHHHPEGFTFVNYNLDGSTIFNKKRYAPWDDPGVFYKKTGKTGNTIEEALCEEVEWGTFRSSTSVSLICSMKYYNGLITQKVTSLSSPNYTRPLTDVKSREKQVLDHMKSGLLGRLKQYKTRDEVTVINEFQLNTKHFSLLEFCLGKLR